MLAAIIAAIDKVAGLKRFEHATSDVHRHPHSVRAPCYCLELAFEVEKDFELSALAKELRALGLDVTGPYSHHVVGPCVEVRGGFFIYRLGFAI